MEEWLLSSRSWMIHHGVLYFGKVDQKLGDFNNHQEMDYVTFNTLHDSHVSSHIEKKSIAL